MRISNIALVLAVAVFVGAGAPSCSDEPNAGGPDAGWLDGQSPDAGPLDGALPDAGADAGPDAGPTVIAWEPEVVATLDATWPHLWSDFPLQVAFTHEDGQSLTLDGYWVGGDRWAVRFAAPRVGRWTWTASTATGDPGLSGSGSFDARAPTQDEVLANPNLRGHVRRNGRYFAYADGTPFLPLGDTFWKFNTLLPLGSLDSGFDLYLDDRTAKGYNSVLIEYIESNPDENPNEGGYLWDPDIQPPTPVSVDWERINPAYFDFLDQRIQAFWDRGLVIFGHPTWIVEQASMTLDQAVNLSRYLLARYGSYNIVWSLTGEFHLACEPGSNGLFCQDNFAGVADLGRWVGGSQTTAPARPGFNPYQHPMSVHPSGSDLADPDPNLQTSRIFDGEDWLDHHWIQTYAETDKIVYRVAELRGEVPGGLGSHLPVFLAEPSYENHPSSRFTDWDQGSGEAKEASKARRQAWTAMFVGAAGYVYGAHGIWQADNLGALDYAGSSTVPLVKDLLLALGWPALTPAACVEVQNGGSWAPPALDYPWGGSHAEVLTYTYAPRCLMQPGGTIAIYIPAGNQGQTIHAVMLGGQELLARWFNPRDGSWLEINANTPVNGDHDERFLLPDRPSPSDDDWVLVLTRP